MQRSRLVALAAIAMAVLIAACGGSSKTATKTSASSVPSTSAASTSGSSSTRVALITSKHNGKLGTILADGNKKMTVYLFEGDKGKSSSCTGPCASVWPAVTGKPKATNGATSADLGTIKRPDGTMQVTYKGLPLYFFHNDSAAGDTNGNYTGWSLVHP